MLKFCPFPQLQLILARLIFFAIADFNKKREMSKSIYHRTRSNPNMKRHGFAQVSRKLSIFNECIVPTCSLFLRFFWRSVPLPPLFEVVPAWVAYGESTLLLGCVTQNTRAHNSRTTLSQDETRLQQKWFQPSARCSSRNTADCEVQVLHDWGEVASSRTL